MTTRRWFLAGSVGMVLVSLNEGRATATPPNGPPTCRHTHQCPSGLVCRDDHCVPDVPGDPTLTCAARVFNESVTICLGRLVNNCHAVRRANRRRACHRRQRRAALVCRTNGTSAAVLTCAPAAP